MGQKPATTDKTTKQQKTHLTRYLKTQTQKEQMRENGKILAELMNTLKQNAKPGTELMELENQFIKHCNKHKANPSCKGYTAHGHLPPFPTGLCISINNQAVHCFPTPNRIIKDTDIITIDTVLDKNGMHVDMAFCIAMPNATPIRKKLVETSIKALNNSINVVKHGVRIGEISHQMYTTARKENFFVLLDYAGHGIGEEMHEWPEVPCYGNPKEGPGLEEDMTICVESLLCSKGWEVESVGEWETRMLNGGDFAQNEHTILVTKEGFEVITQL